MKMPTPFESIHSGAAVASSSDLIRARKARPIAAFPLFKDKSKRKWFAYFSMGGPAKAGEVVTTESCHGRAPAFHHRASARSSVTITTRSLRAAPVSKAAKAGAFVSTQRRTQRRTRFFVSMEAPMDQREFPFMARMNAPSVAHPYWLNQCKTYREAVRMAWSHRRIHHMTQRQLACEAGLRPQLISDYLKLADGSGRRRDLPADRIAAFEGVVGNTLVSQWVAAQSKLTVLEEMQAARIAA
jgi:hypothetical protein